MVFLLNCYFSKNFTSVLALSALTLSGFSVPLYAADDNKENENTFSISPKEKDLNSKSESVETNSPQKKDIKVAADVEGVTELLEAFQAFNEDSLSYRNEVGAVQHAYLINYYEKNEPQEGAVKKAFAFLKQGIPSLFGKTIDELKTELICIFENAFEGVEFKESAQFQNLKNYTAYLMKALPEEVRKKFSDFVKDHKISDEYRNLNQDEINENYKAENLLLQNLFNSKKLAEKSKLLSPLKF